MQQVIQVNEKEAIELLKKYSKDEKSFEIVLAHSKKVQEIALRLSEGKNADKEFISVASLLHDIGRFDCPPGEKTIYHGIVGAEILRKEKVGESFAKVCERHLGSGISKADIIEQGLDLPKKDYIPETMEEKIIALADNLTFGDREGTIEEVYERFKKEINVKTADKAMRLYREVKGKIYK